MVHSEWKWEEWPELPLLDCLPGMVLCNHITQLSHVIRLYTETWRFRGLVGRGREVVLFPVESMNIYCSLLRKFERGKWKPHFLSLFYFFPWNSSELIYQLGLKG